MTAVLFSIGNARVTAYALFCALGLCAFAALGLYMCRFYRTVSRRDFLAYALRAFPVSLFCARALYCIVNYDEQSFWGAFCLWRGGYALTGAAFGAYMCAYLFARARRVPPGRMLDVITPGALAFVCVARIAERFTGQGVGKIVTTPFMRAGLFTVTDTYGEIRHCVWRYEALAALFALAVFAFVFLRLRKRRAKLIDGEAFRMAALAFCMSQIVLESLRDDRYLHIDFFRIQQIASMLAFVGTIAWYCAKLWKTGKYRRELWALMGVVALSLSVTVAQEFAVDREGNLEAKYLFMYVSLALAAACALIVRRSWRKLAAKKARKRVPAGSGR